MKLLDLLKCKKHYKETGAVEKEDVKAGEKELNIHFSKEFCDYLEIIGSATIYGHEFTGLGNKVINNVVDITKEIREIDDKFPNNIYVIEQTNIDGILICQDEEGLVYEFFPSSKPKKIFNSFAEYVESL